ncbi:hypothetical protein ZWY2020_044555 [Hordeum vulgare]|nr:hypothetical protein ZWY2020_044555 [Hordeum vulgare]
MDSGWTLGSASGAEVFLAADDASGELFAVKSAAGASSAAALRREQRVMAELRSPRVVSCIGGRAARDGSYQLFLELAQASLADRVATSGARQWRRLSSATGVATGSRTSAGRDCAGASSRGTL